MPIAGRAKALEGLCLGGACLLLAACAGTAPADPVESAPVQGLQTSGDGAAVAGPIHVLAPRELGEGKCGLFLYARQAEPKFIFYAPAGAGAAQMNLNGRIVGLPRSGAAAAAGMAADQIFESEGGVRVELTLERGEALTGGVRIPGGSLRLSQPDGWDLVVPVTGLTACQTD